MKRFFKFLSSFITKVSTPLCFLPFDKRHREGLGVGLLLALSILFAACGPDKEHGRVKGAIKGINDTRIQAYVEGLDGKIDTIDVKKGKFTYERALKEPVILTFIYPNYTSTSLVLGPGETVKIKGDANSLNTLDIDGNDDNRLITEFRKHTAGKSDSEQRREAATFVRSHPKTLAAVILFREYFANERTIEENPTASLLEELEKAQPRNALVTQMAEHLHPILATAPGKPFPQFAAVDVKGDSIRSADLNGKGALVVVGGYLDGYFYNMKRHATDLKARVDTTAFKFVFISLDNDKALCKQDATYTPLPGPVICDGKSFESPLVKKLGLRYVPTVFVIGKDGLIKARDIPMEEWAKTVPSLL